MTPKHEKMAVYGSLAIGAAVILWLYFSRQKPLLVNNANDGFPYTGGFPYSPYIQYGNNGVPINSPSTIAFQIGQNGFGALSNQYMPLFGFIGQAGLA